MNLRSRIRCRTSVTTAVSAMPITIDAMTPYSLWVPNSGYTWKWVR